MSDLQQSMLDLDDTLFKATIPASLAGMSPLPPGSMRDDPFVREDPRRRWVKDHAGQEVRIVERNGMLFRAIASDGTTGHLLIDEYDMLPNVQPVDLGEKDERRLYPGPAIDRSRPKTA